MKLLIISCSKRKKRVSEPTSAFDLYDGVHFRVVKKLKREGNLPKDLAIAMISAKYGLLFPTDPITFYDEAMSLRRALELRDDVRKELAALLNERQYDSVFVSLGKSYLSAVGNLRELAPTSTQLTYAEGGIGRRSAQMKTWLCAEDHDAQS